MLQDEASQTTPVLQLIALAKETFQEVLKTAPTEMPPITDEIIIGISQYNIVERLAHPDYPEKPVIHILQGKGGFNNNKIGFATKLDLFRRMGETDTGIYDAGKAKTAMTEAIAYFPVSGP